MVSARYWGSALRTYLRILRKGLLELLDPLKDCHRGSSLEEVFSYGEGARYPVSWGGRKGGVWWEDIEVGGSRRKGWSLRSGRIYILKERGAPKLSSLDQAATVNWKPRLELNRFTRTVFYQDPSSRVLTHPKNPTQRPGSRVTRVLDRSLPIIFLQTQSFQYKDPSSIHLAESRLSCRKLHLF